MLIFYNPHRNLFFIKLSFSFLSFFKAGEWCDESVTMTGGQPHTIPLCSYRRIRRSFHERRRTSFSSPCCCCFFRKFSFSPAHLFFNPSDVVVFPQPTFFFFHFFFFNFVGCQFAWQRRQRLVPETVALWRRVMTGWSATTTTTGKKNNIFSTYCWWWPNWQPGLSPPLPPLSFQRAK